MSEHHIDCPYPRGKCVCDGPPKAGWITAGVHHSGGFCIPPSDRPALEAKVAKALRTSTWGFDPCNEAAHIALDAIFGEGEK